MISSETSIAGLIDGLRHPRKTALIIALLVAVSVAQYANIIHNGFVWDSNAVFVEDASTRDLGNIPEYFTRGYSLAEDLEGQATYSRYYRPLVKLLHALEYKAFAQEPMGYKLMSILLNTITVVLGFLFVKRASGSAAVALAASLLYAVSPARAEAVSWSYSDSYLLMSVFVLLSLIAYQRGRLALSAMMFACALMSWEGAILLPAVLVAYEALISRSRAMRQYYKLLPFFALAAGYLLLRGYIVGSLPVTEAPLPAYIATVLVIVKTALRAAFAPEAPVTIYLYRAYTGPGPEVLTSVLAAAGLAILAAVLWRRDRQGLFWAAWFMIWIAISFNIGKLTEYLFADKFLVLAALGPCVLLAGLLRLRGRPSLAAAVLLCGLFVFHFSATLERNRYYSDTITYIEKALEHEPRLKVGLFALGAAYQEAGDTEAALRNYMALLDYYPDAPVMVREAIGRTYRQRAQALIEAGEYTDALEAYGESFGWLPGDSGTYNNMGNIYFRQGMDGMAVESWQKALELDPSNPEPLFNMGAALERQGEYARAMESYRRFAESGHAMGPKALERIEALRAGKR